jgi:hypothetical protein
MVEARKAENIVIYYLAVGKAGASYQLATKVLQLFAVHVMSKHTVIIF